MFSCSLASSLIREASHGGLEDQVDGAGLQARDLHDRVLDPARHFAGHRAARRGQGHVDGHVLVVADIDLVDQAQLIDVDRDFRVIDRLQLLDQQIGQLGQLFLGKAETVSGTAASVIEGLN